MKDLWSWCSVSLVSFSYSIWRWFEVHNTLASVIQSTFPHDPALLSRRWRLHRRFALLLDRVTSILHIVTWHHHKKSNISTLTQHQAEKRGSIGRNKLKKIPEGKLQSTVINLCSQLFLLHYILDRNTHRIMTSSNGNVFCVTGPLWREFSSRRPMALNLIVFFDLRPNKQLGKQSRRRWFETPSHSL